MISLQEWQQRFPDMEVCYEIEGMARSEVVNKYIYRGGTLWHRKKGKQAGYLIDGRRYIGKTLMSRWVFFYHCGFLTANDDYVIDHVNNDPSRDDIGNLQILPRIENWHKGINADVVKRRTQTCKDKGVALFSTWTPEFRSQAAKKAAVTQLKRGTGFRSEKARIKRNETLMREKKGFHDPAVQALSRTPEALAKRSAAYRLKHLNRQRIDLACAFWAEDESAMKKLSQRASSRRYTQKRRIQAAL